MRRRRVLKAAGATAFAGLIAGCSDQGPGAEETPTETGTPAETEAPTETGTPTEQEAPQETPAGTETGTPGDVQLEQRQGQLPQGLQLSNLQIEGTDSGAQVTGVVENTGDQTYDQLELQVTLLDDSDDILGQFFDNTEQSDFEPPLEPGESWEFTVDFSSADLGNAVGYRVDVDTSIDENVDIDIGGETETETTSGNVQLEQRQGQLPEGLQLTNIEIEDTDSGAEVTGVVENTGDQTYDELELQITLLDDTDDVLGQFFDNTEQSEVELPFGPGATWNFTVDFPSADLGNAVGYRVDVDTSIDENVDISFGTETPTA